ncbi:hypothetical protein AGLY_002878 [Aphis glycines]|uniref:Uncharacterized protein n=1 Tax=Aphis glycines TaxID=307491 RepID=A0A6G0U1X5_APHGL|nr:hypothetical protein AGLY_002878 [Aphis glycines]
MENLTNGMLLSEDIIYLQPTASIELYNIIHYLQYSLSIPSDIKFNNTRFVLLNLNRTLPSSGRTNEEQTLYLVLLLITEINLQISNVLSYSSGSVKYLTLSISNNYKQVIKTQYLCGAWTIGSFPHKTITYTLRYQCTNQFTIFPIAQMEVGYCFVGSLVATKPENNKINELCDYLCYSSDKSLTRNACKSFHSVFNLNFYHHHANIFIIIEVLKIFDISNKYVFKKRTSNCNIPKKK